VLRDKIAVFVLREGMEYPDVYSIPVSRQQLLYRFLEPYEREILNRPRIVHAGRQSMCDWLILGEALLAPIQSSLSGVRLVYFVPHSWLHLMPLHALTVNGKAFIEQYAVAYAPSAMVLNRVLERKSAATEEEGTALVMGYTPNAEERNLFLGEAQAIANPLEVSLC